MVKIEGTLDEIRELVGDVKRTVSVVKETNKKVRSVAKKTTRKLSKWHAPSMLSALDAIKE